MGGPGQLENLVLVRLECVELDCELAQIPQGNGAVTRTGRKDEFATGAEGDTIHLGGVGVDVVDRLV